MGTRTAPEGEGVRVLPAMLWIIEVQVMGNYTPSGITLWAGLSKKKELQRGRNETSITRLLFHVLCRMRVAQRWWLEGDVTKGSPIPSFFGFSLSEIAAST